MDISINGMTKKYGEKTVFKEFSLYIKEKSILGILGNSGSGKTTFLNAMSAPSEYGGTIKGVPENISYVFQEQNLIKEQSVYKNLEFVLKGCVKGKLERANRIIKALYDSELIDVKNAYPDELSTGMAQRVAIARAFVYPSELILMDEPFRGLDMGTKARLIKNFIKLWENSKRTVVFVTHTVEEALTLCDKIVVIGNTPAEVIGEFEIGADANRLERDLTSPDFVGIRNSVLKLFGL